MGTINVLKNDLSFTLKMKHPGTITVGKEMHESFFISKPVGTAYYVLPAYNEEDTLPHLLKRIAKLQAKVTQKIMVLVINDGSNDKTAELALTGSPGLNIKLINHAVNMGLGQAVQTGIKQALEIANDEDIIIVMDADDTHDVNLLKPMVEKIEGGSDIVIASRFVDGGDDSTAPTFRRLLSRGAGFIFKTILPLNNVKDFTSGYRAYRVNMLRRISKHWGERIVEEKGFACMVELLLKLRHWSPKISEVPMNLRYDRKLSESKLKLFKTIFQYIKLALRDRLAPPPRGL